jgi:UDP-GlcNAc3NAcA epimerase
MLIGIESVLKEQKPQVVAVFGDTNTTLAGALSAKKLKLPVIHIEAGLRSYHLNVAEEINRTVTDHISDLLMCPCESTFQSCAKEGLLKKAFLVGDIMYDHFLRYSGRAHQPDTGLPLLPKRYHVATIHRAEAMEKKENLSGILCAFGQMTDTVILPLHPRTRNAIRDYHLDLPENILILDPLGYLQMASLLHGSDKVFTDSSGIQKEAFFWRKPCIVLRKEREWLETITSGWAIIAGFDSSDILEAVQSFISRPPQEPSGSLFGKGDAGDRILEILSRHFASDGSRANHSMPDNFDDSATVASSRHTI